MRNLTLVAAFTTLISAVPAFAEGFSVRDLEEVRSRDECMRRAQLAMNAHTKGFGGDVVVADWIVYGWDLGPGDNDVTLMCPVVADGVINAFMVIHSTTSEEDRTYVANEIERLFN